MEEEGGAGYSYSAILNPPKVGTLKWLPRNYLAFSFDFPYTPFLIPALVG
jgi:hypothetical protein